MTIEHRFSTKCPVDLDVAVAASGIQRFRGRARELSVHGMFIAAQRTGLSLDELVQLDIQLGREVHRVSGHTVRVEADGIGVLFQDLASETYRALWQAACEDKMPSHRYFATRLPMRELGA